MNRPEQTYAADLDDAGRRLFADADPGELRRALGLKNDGQAAALLDPEAYGRWSMPRLLRMGQERGWSLQELCRRIAG